MERTIKFRGYNRKNKQWLYGFYLQNRGAYFVCPDEFATGKSWDDYEIEPETLGQFTGLTDKNGREIYEGDIVLTYDVRGPYRINYQHGIWVLIDADCNWIGFTEEFNEIGIRSKIETTEVIGNIYENSELLNKD